MKWRVGPKDKFDYTLWHDHFAWKPILIGDYKHWLCLVSRRVLFTYEVDIEDQKTTIRHTKEYTFEYKEIMWY